MCLVHEDSLKNTKVVVMLEGYFAYFGFNWLKLITLHQIPLFLELQYDHITRASILIMEDVEAELGISMQQRQ